MILTFFEITFTYALKALDRDYEAYVLYLKQAHINYRSIILCKALQSYLVNRLTAYFQRMVLGQMAKSHNNNTATAIFSKMKLTEEMLVSLPLLGKITVHTIYCQYACILVLSVC